MPQTVCQDTLLIDQYGYPAATLFEKVWFLIHKSENAADFTNEKDGKVWGYFTYPRLTEMFDRTRPDGSIANAIGSERSVRYAVDNLVADGVMIRRRSQAGFYLAIDFNRLQSVVGKEGMTRYVVCQEFDKATNPLCQEFDKSTKPTPPTLSKVRQTERQEFDKAPIYKELDSLEESQKTTTSANADGTSAALTPIEDDLLGMPPATDVFSAIGRVVFSGLVIDGEMRKQIREMIGRIENTQIWVGKEKVNPHLDPQIIEDYSIWRMLISDTGKRGFPSAEEFLGEFRFQFFKWYWTPSNRTPLEKIKTAYPDWRDRLNGDYGEFRREVQAKLMPTRAAIPPTPGSRGTMSPLARTPEQRRKAGHKIED